MPRTQTTAEGRRDVGHFPPWVVVAVVLSQHVHELPLTEDRYPVNTLATDGTGLGPQFFHDVGKRLGSVTGTVFPSTAVQTVRRPSTTASRPGGGLAGFGDSCELTGQLRERPLQARNIIERGGALLRAILIWTNDSCVSPWLLREVTLEHRERDLIAAGGPSRPRRPRDA